MGVGVGERVGVRLGRGVSQLEAVLGVLAAGCVFVPVGVEQPLRRRERMYARAGVQVVLAAGEVTTCQLLLIWIERLFGSLRRGWKELGGEASEIFGRRRAGNHRCRVRVSSIAAKDLDPWPE